MLDALAGWLGLALFGVALALAVALEVGDQLAHAGRDHGRHRRGQRARWRLMHVVLAVVVLAVLGATVARFYVYVY